MKRLTASLVAIALIASDASTLVLAQDYSKYSQEALDKELARNAVARLGVMVPMRDGVALSTDVYTPKNAKGPTVEKDADTMSQQQQQQQQSSGRH